MEIQLQTIYHFKAFGMMYLHYELRILLKRAHDLIHAKDLNNKSPLHYLKKPAHVVECNST